MELNWREWEGMGGNKESSGVLLAFSLTCFSGKGNRIGELTEGEGRLGYGGVGAFCCGCWI